MKKLLYLVAAVMIFTSCETENSDDVNQDRIYTAYELFYNSNTDVTTAVARFKFGGVTGTNLELSDGAYCLFNNDTLVYSGFWVGHIKEYPGLITNGTFTYEDTDGEIYVNNTPIMDTIGQDPNLNVISKSSSNVITWQGNALAFNEQVNVFIGSWTWGGDALAVQTLTGATDIVLGTNQTANLAEGTATIHLERVATNNLTESTSEGGEIRVKYKAQNTNITVSP